MSHKDLLVKVEDNWALVFNMVGGWGDVFFGNRFVGYVTNGTINFVDGSEELVDEIPQWVENELLLFQVRKRLLNR